MENLSDGKREVVPRRKEVVSLVERYESVLLRGCTAIFLMISMNYQALRHWSQ